MGGGGGGKGGGKGGGGGGGGGAMANPYMNQLAGIAQDLYNQTTPLRGYFLQDWANFMRPPGFSGYGGVGGNGGGGTPTGGGEIKPLEGQQLFRRPDGSIVSLSQYTPVIRGHMGEDQYQVGMGDTRKLGFMDFMNNPQGWLNQSMSPQMKPTGKYYDAQGFELTPMGSTPNTGGGGGTLGTVAPTGGYYQSGARYDPYNLPGYAPLYQLSRQGIENQFAQARQGLIGSAPRGGALTDALGNLEMGRAVQAGSLPAQTAAPLIQDIINKAYGAAWNAPQQSMAGMSGAGNMYGSMYNTNTYAGLQGQALNNQMWGGIGSGIGSLGAMGLKAATGGKG